MLQRKCIWLLFFSIFIIFNSCTPSSPERKLLVSNRLPPYSADPLDYDAFIHHISFRSVLSPLISNYRAGNILGIIAESWASSPDHKKWTFKIRKNIHFENGDEITASIVALSLKRISFLLLQRGSHAGLAEWIEGSEKLTSPHAEIPGISSSREGIVTLQFKKSMPKLLDLLSFGMYSIAHPNDFDPQTGKWKNLKRVTSSGYYRVSDWTENNLQLTLREDFLPDLRHARPIRLIEIVHGSSNLEKPDLIIGTSYESSPSADFQFHGGALSGILYIACRSWALKDSPCYKVENRRNIRNAFYEAAKSIELQTSTSFFPTVMKGITEFEYPTAFPFKTGLDTRPLRYNEVVGRTSKYIDGYKTGIELAAKTVNFPLEKRKVSTEIFMKEYELNLPTYVSDLYLLSTGILIDDPDDDIRFMFLSKEGIRLPDSNGKILTELKSSKLNPQKINALLWEQAIIWPVTHFASGFWAKSDLDFSQINLILPPTDFSLLGWK
jgi:hypothetical protein